MSCRSLPDNAHDPILPSPVPADAAYDLNPSASNQLNGGMRLRPNSNLVGDPANTHRAHPRTRPTTQSHRKATIIALVGNALRRFPDLPHTPIQFIVVIA
ncbi:hypothetical protein [Pedosphaera parvula]|uniref:Uncharacterized protein n=1 Tax=Pedosphaera parvula (strain Ellin514) TaxID=320771 RepID=B9XCS7_PEDPL|nr:hypothetical protein [Pedosphaera parvula]EEF62273.1 hypothetical protein Cflav_PD4908 [Pedosphaera parvula Ellin514]